MSCFKINSRFSKKQINSFKIFEEDREELEKYMRLDTGVTFRTKN